MRINARNIFTGLLIAGVAGAILLLPAIGFVGSLFVSPPSPPTTTHVPPLVGDALWAMANGGRATQLQPLNPFTLGRMASCHLWAERLDDPRQVAAEHDECMKLIPAVEAIGYVSNLHLQKQGVWNDPRVPFAGFATMNNVADRWTRPQLLEAFFEGAEFSFGFHGVEQASRGFFNRSAAELTLPQAALLAGLFRERHQDPWCWPGSTATIRHGILEKMRDNLALDDAAFQSADVAPLALNPEPPQDRKPCR